MAQWCEGRWLWPAPFLMIQSNRCRLRTPCVPLPLLLGDERAYGGTNPTAVEINPGGPCCLPLSGRFRPNGHVRPVDPLDPVGLFLSRKGRRRSFKEAQTGGQREGIRPRNPGGGAGESSSGSDFRRRLLVPVGVDPHQAARSSSAARDTAAGSVPTAVPPVVHPWLARFCGGYRNPCADGCQTEALEADSACLRHPSPFERVGVGKPKAKWDEVALRATTRPLLGCLGRPSSRSTTVRRPSR
jgi:hypothetical protein